MTVRKNITIPDELSVFIDKNHINLSRFVQDKLGLLRDNENNLYYVKFFKNSTDRYFYGIFDNWDDIEKARSDLSKRDNTEYDIEECELSHGETNTFCVTKIKKNEIVNSRFA